MVSLREDLLLFTYLHMAAAPELADAMVNAKTTGVALRNSAVAKKATYHFWFQ